jgi:lipopolysaccharide assembly outer membrane protein LptD (OstA)
MYADAYLSEDRIYYSADRYDIDYGREIITAEGNATFRREDIIVRAQKAVIHYAEGKKRAYFYGRVRMENSREGYTVGGNYGEVHYEKRYAFVKGDAFYRDGERSVRRFTGDVVFRDAAVTVTSGTLLVRGEEEAIFAGDSRVRFEETGDRLFCRTLSQNIRTGVSEFSGDVIYFEAENAEERRSPFIIQAGVIRYHPDSDSYICLDHVRAVNEEYTLIAPVLRYDRRREKITTEGESVVRSGSSTVYCTNLTFDVETGTTEFSGEVKGFVAGDRGEKR